ncbi:DUF1538 domain-containing protein [Pannonibacter phragmitetus]|uniref:DUF1538 domain-containing protein n=1 Tax=Pannonibacter phragmitetus TaxID=121719 RepID=UPI000F02883C|nr:DUF1538 domain-containing protein [Pannonibacter phragmitetus]
MPRLLSRVFLPLIQNGRDLAPVILVIAFFQLVIVQEPVPDLTGKIIGLGFVLLGLTLFLAGLSLSLFPLGERLAEEFARRANLWLLLAFAFAIGFGSTVAEPALIAVTEQAATAMASTGAPDETTRTALVLRLATSAAVGLAVVLSCVRILLGWPALAPILAIYGAACLLVLVQPSPMSGIAFDAGAAATSAINIPLIAALGIGLATVLEGRSPLADGFGAVALASAMPMITILLGASFFG